MIILNWKKWLNQISFWQIIDTETRHFVKYTRVYYIAGYRQPECDLDSDLSVAELLYQILCNMSFTDFKIARGFIKTCNFLYGRHSYKIEWT